MPLDPRKYLSKEAFDSLSLVLNSEDDDTYKQAVILKDGTTVIVEKPRNKVLDHYKLDNPNDVRINCPCVVEVVYGEEDDEEHAHFTVDSMDDLLSKWDDFRDERGLSEDTEGTIRRVSLTSEQMERINDTREDLNDIINILLDDDTEIGNTIYSSMEDANASFKRISIINMIMNEIIASLFSHDICDKVHLPYMISDATGNHVEVKEFVYKI